MVTAAGTKNDIAAQQPLDQWYLGWEEYIRTEFYEITPEVFCPKIRWDVRQEKWYMWNVDQRLYCEIDESVIDAIFFEWAKDQLKTSQSYLAHAKTRLRAMVRLDTTWNHDDLYENILDGMINKQTLEIIPHGPQFLFYSRIPRHYRPQMDRYARLIFNNILTATSTPKRLLRYYVAIVHNRHDDEMFLMLYGKKGAGKSTLLRIPELLFGKECVSKTTLQNLGKNFGLTECYDKRVNVNPDLPATMLKADAISILKQLTGQDGYIEVNIKGTPQFKWLINCFLTFGANQLMQFDRTVSQEVESVMRRACLCSCQNTQKPCPAYKEIIAEPEFLDEVYSELLRTPYEPIMDKPIDEWCQSTLNEWLSNCDPILPILKELYDWTNNENDKLNCYSVKAEVQERLEEEGFVVPQDLLADITTAFKSMKVYKDEKRGPKANYTFVGKKGMIEINQIKYVEPN